MLLREQTLADREVQEEALALPPYAYVRQTPLILLRQYKLIYLAFLASSRSLWLIQVLAGIVAPLGLVLFSRAMLGDITPQKAIFLLGGNMVVSITFGPGTFLISWLGMAMEKKEMYYWMMLPVSKTIVTQAVLGVSITLALPGLAGTYLLGVLFLGLPLSGGWALFLLALLSALSISGLAAFLGYCVSDIAAASVVSNLLIMVVTFLSPIMIPMAALPLPLRLLSLMIPTTYAADAFRSVMAGQAGSNLIVDILFLALSSVVFLGLAQWRLRWRMR
jgi:ABC-2 type transport system permease protein